MTGALTAIDAKDFTRHEAGRLEAENRVDDVGDLTGIMAQTPQAKQR
jgi:hypothetical protein